MQACKQSQRIAIPFDQPCVQEFLKLRANPEKYYGVCPSKPIVFLKLLAFNVACSSEYSDTTESIIQHKMMLSVNRQQNGGS